MNLALCGLRIQLVGAICNFLALKANGGRMPCLQKTVDDATHVTISADTKLRFLCDIFQGKNCTFSVGDVLLFAGLPLGLYGMLRNPDDVWTPVYWATMCLVYVLAAVMHKMQIQFYQENYIYLRKGRSPAEEL